MDKETPHYGPADRPPLKEWIPLSIQHVFAMFGATILVPILVGLDPTTALFTAGTGTLIYILLTKAMVPAFIGSSFAFITPLITISSQYGWPYAMGGAFASGLMYALVAFIISKAGSGWIHRALPPVVIGSVIIVIGLNLAPTAMNMAMYTNTADTSTYSIHTSEVQLRSRSYIRHSLLCNHMRTPGRHPLHFTCSRQGFL